MSGYRFYPSLLFFSIFISFPTVGNAQAGKASSPAGAVLEQAESKTAEGDTAAALVILSRALESDPELWEAYLARGRLYLARGERDAAVLDFTHALKSKAADIRCRAHMGLGECYRSMEVRKLEAIQEYRLAIKADPGNPEAYHRLAQAALAINDPNGYNIASEELLKLTFLDPCYKNAYETWRDTMLVKKDSEMRKACQFLEKYIEGHPEKTVWLLDIAGYRYRLNEYKAALSILDRLEQASPPSKPSERCLVRARCLLALDDTLGFEQAYNEALEEAARDGDFRMLIRQAEAIFNPTEQKKTERMETAEDWAEFFRVFWARRDPDPLTPHNERLIEHYQRLREAERLYTVKIPYSIILNSPNAYRLASFNTEGNIEAPYEYDPDLFWNRCPDLALEQRGLLYIRHGPPDRILLPEPPRYKPIPDEEVWRYGNVYFPFRAGRIGGSDVLSINYYFFVPVAARGMGNIKKAMETESFKDPIPHPEYKQDYYGTYFRGERDWIELEVYQSVPVAEAKAPEPPGCSLAVFDSTWQETGRDSSQSFKALTGGDSLWIGVNRVTDLWPGECIYALRLDVPGQRAIQRKPIMLRPYSRALDLSGIILGSTPEAGEKAHRRMGVDILPRPSLRFLENENIAVYLEIYNLRRDATGAGHYQESVTLTREGGQDGLSSVLKRLINVERSRSTSLTLSFERQVEGGTITAVPEHFTIDTSMLVPGSYSMKIEVLDTVRGSQRQAGCLFELGK